MARSALTRLAGCVPLLIMLRSWRGRSFLFDRFHSVAKMSTRRANAFARRPSISVLTNPNHTRRCRRSVSG